MAALRIPPNYRKAETYGKQCSTCKYYVKVGMSCRRYIVKVYPDYVCRSWKVTVKKASINDLNTSAETDKLDENKSIGGAMSFEKMSDAELSYLEGFIIKCAEAGVDPEELVKQAQFWKGVGNVVGGGLRQLPGAKQIGQLGAGAAGLLQGGMNQARQSYAQAGQYGAQQAAQGKQQLGQWAGGTLAGRAGGAMGRAVYGTGGATPDQVGQIMQGQMAKAQRRQNAGQQVMQPQVAGAGGPQGTPSPSRQMRLNVLQQNPGMRPANTAVAGGAIPSKTTVSSDAGQFLNTNPRMAGLPNKPTGTRSGAYGSYPLHSIAQTDF